jgi:thioredoxin
MAIKVTSKNFKTAVLGSSKPVVVDVWADWCGPCKMLAPQFEAAAEELKGKARFVKIDADKNQKIVRKYGVRGLPSLLYFKDGQLVDRSTGVTTKNSIIRKVKPLLNEEDRTEMKTGFNWKFWK